jgi:hypothetical protein
MLYDVAKEIYPAGPDLNRHSIAAEGF